MPASPPGMTFVSTKVEPDGQDKAEVTGDLTPHLVIARAFARQD